MTLQLNPPLPMLTPRGPGWAHFLIDYGQEHDLLWVVFLDNDGASWTFPNPVVRMVWNETMGRVPFQSSSSNATEATPRTRA